MATGGEAATRPANARNRPGSARTPEGSAKAGAACPASLSRNSAARACKRSLTCSGV